MQYHYLMMVTFIDIGAWTNDGDEGDRNGHVRVYQYSDEFLETDG